MASPIATEMVEKGIDNVNFSMLNPILKSQILVEAAELLIHKGRYDEAVDALIKAENPKKCLDLGTWFEDKHLFKHAAYCYIYSEDKVKMKTIAEICVKQGLYATAKQVYIALADESMIDFVEHNFPNADSH